MKRFMVVFGLGAGLLLHGCGQEGEPEVGASQEQKEVAPVSENSFAARVKSPQTKPLSETKKGEFFSSKMLPLAELVPETNEDIFVHLKGRVINIDPQEVWAVLQDGDAYYFAFGHAGMSKIKKSFLGKEIYIRTLLDEIPLTEDIIRMVQKNGLAPGNVPDSINKGYQLNTKVAALVTEMDAETFMALKK